MAPSKKDAASLYNWLYDAAVKLGGGDAVTGIGVLKVKCQLPDCMARCLELRAKKKQ